MRIELKRFQATNIYHLKDIEVPDSRSQSRASGKKICFGPKKTLTELPKRKYRKGEKKLTELCHRKCEKDTH